MSGLMCFYVRFLCVDGLVVGKVVKCVVMLMSVFCVDGMLFGEYYSVVVLKCVSLC